jgi:hypothetical protein
LTFLSAEELLDLLSGADYDLVPSAPTTLVPDGAVLVWPACSPLSIPAGYGAVVFEGSQVKCLLVIVTPEIYEALK